MTSLESLFTKPLTVILIPPVPMAAGGPEAAQATSEDDQLAQMGGATLGDL